MIIIHADFKVFPDKKQSFLEAVQPLVQGSQAEAGCIRYTLMQLVGDETAYTMVEEWKDQEAVDAHNASEHFQSFGRFAPSFLADKMNVKVFRTTDTE
ncbi:putative quinol monooxygenase [Gorillibacterium timonense]|uniref:putative quinol monooxygenase n=1 Tax=Gorillibacterium timonense TaxID=1689269 RepID=UPI00071C5E00|nr:putative quinol monooxygenase [Gorillibacterium timonense]